MHCHLANRRQGIRGSLRNERETRAGRAGSQSAVYVIPGRLERKNLLSSRVFDPTPVPGETARRLVNLTREGLNGVKAARAAMKQHWNGILDMVPDRHRCDRSRSPSRATRTLFARPAALGTFPFRERRVSAVRVTGVSPHPRPNPMAQANVPITRLSSSRLHAYYELTKPGIAGYVMVTAGVSAFVASSGRIELALAIHTIAGTGLATAGALTLNQFVERDVDAIMHRTQGRPLPTARVAPMEALAFGSALLLGGLVYMGLAIGALPALITAMSGLMYHGVYTPLKTRSYMATLAGAVPGALPMLIGWTAVTGSIDPGGLALFAIGYLWQLPHVLGLAWMLRADYARVGFRLIPEGGARSIGTQMVASTALLIPVSWTPTILGFTGLPYALGAALLGLAFLTTAIRARSDMTDERARGVFLASLLYHPLLLGFMLFDTLRILMTGA